MKILKMLKICLTRPARAPRASLLTQPGTLQAVRPGWRRVVLKNASFPDNSRPSQTLPDPPKPSQALQTPKKNMKIPKMLKICLLRGGVSSASGKVRGLFGGLGGLGGSGRAWEWEGTQGPGREPGKGFQGLEGICIAFLCCCSSHIYIWYPPRYPRLS